MDSHSTRHFRAAFVAAAFALALAFVPAMAFTPQAGAATLDYGSLSREYETGGDPTAADSYWGYGAYQMLSDNALEYATWLFKKSNATYKSWGEGLLAAHEKDSSDSYLYFNAMWRYVAGTELDKLSSADEKRVKKVTKSTTVQAGSSKKALSLQYKYALKVYYKPALKYWKKLASTFDASDYSIALRSVIFSIAVANGPYGSAQNIFKPTLKTLGGWKKGLSEKKLIKALYNERSKAVKKAPGTPAHKITASTANAKKYNLVGKYLKHYYSSSAAVQVAVYKRFRYDEKSDALKLLKKATSCKHAKTSGGKVTKYYDLTDSTHMETRTAKVCLVCGKTVEKAGSYQVENVFVMSGAQYKDVSGRVYTVHGKGYYKVVPSTLKFRKSPSTSAKSLGSIAKGTLLKVTESRLAEDGFWWGKTTYGKKSGWVRMEYLSPLGTASKHSYSKKGVCKYCGLTRAQESAMAKIRKALKSGSRTCTFTVAGSSYKAAYPSKSLLAKSYAKGATVKVTKVVKNVYNDYWAKLSNGNYVDLALLK